MTTANQIRSRDLYLSAYLLAQGVTYVKTEWINPRQAEFVFAPEDRDEQDRAEQLRRAWVNQTAECQAVKYANCIKLLKSEVHGSERDEREREAGERDGASPTVMRRRIVGR